MSSSARTAVDRLKRRRTLMALGIAAPLSRLVGTPCSHAEVASPAWPTRPVSVVVPYPPGGATDISARIIARQMEKRLGQPFVLLNRAGAGGNIGAQSAVGVAPDGHTLLFGTQGLLTVNPYLYSKLSYDIRRDFVTVGLTYDIAHVIVVNPSVPARTLGQFVELAKREPGKLTYGSSGVGGGTHLFAEYFQEQAGIKLLHIPFQGSTPAKADLMGGQIDAMFDAISSVAPQIKTGAVRALAVTSATRHPQLPDVPTISEILLPGFETTTWGAMLVPSATPAPLVTKIAGDLRSVLADGETRELLEATGTSPLPASLDEARRKIDAEDRRWKEVISRGKLRVE